MNLYETIGTSNPSYLLASPTGADVITVPMEPGNGTVKRGTIVYCKSTGFWAAAAAENAVAANQLAVLDETVDTTGQVGTEKTVAENARVYRAGHFVQGKVTLKNDAAITAAVEVTLRTQGIVFDQMVPGTSFDNSTANSTNDTTN